MNGIFHRRFSGSLMLSGAASMTLDQRMRRRRPQSDAAALKGDWEAIGGDMRRAIRALGSEPV